MSDIHVSRQFAARHRARNRNLISGLLLAQVSPAEVVRELPIVLRLANQGPEHRTGIVGRQKLRSRTQVVPQVRLKPTEVGWIQLTRGIFEEDIHQDIHLRTPPAIDGLLGDTGRLRNPLHGDSGITPGYQQVVGRVQDRFTRGLAAAMPVSEMTAWRVDLTRSDRLIHRVHRITTLD
ncbi:hypothetical protein L828_1248 [Mycobacteroides abscessus MAB_030201_1061]|nr:hypothetical protein L828_1248 [Mycobacteroides abscessus MAB_030201_1061]